LVNQRKWLIKENGESKRNLVNLTMKRRGRKKKALFHEKENERAA